MPFILDSHICSLKSNVPYCQLFTISTISTIYSDAGRWKTLGGPVLMVGIICPPPVGIGLTDLPNIGGASGPPGPPSSGTTVNAFAFHKVFLPFPDHFIRFLLHFFCFRYWSKCRQTKTWIPAQKFSSFTTVCIKPNGTKIIWKKPKF